MAKKKAPNGSGAIRHRENGTWECTIMYGWNPDTGKPLMKSFYAPTQRQVKEKRDAWLRERALNKLTAETYTLAELGERWLSHRGPKMQPQTLEGYKYTLRHIVNSPLGHRDVTSIMPYEVENYLWEMQSKFSASTVTKIKAILFQIYKFGKANKVVDRNIVAETEKLRWDRKKPKDSYTAQELRILMKHLPDNKIGWSIRIMLVTGMRTQEITGLEKHHISEDGSRISIEQAVIHVKGTAEIGPCKTNTSYRVVPIPRIMRQYAIKLRENCTGTLIWESPRKKGSPVNKSYFSDLFRAAVEGVEGVRVLTPHCCRHTFVSMMQTLGVDIETTQSICGHADKKMTQKYLHVQEEVRVHAMERYSQTFGIDESDDQ